MPGTLIIGGVKSGKSSLAERLLLKDHLPSNLHYIATSVALGDELLQRIEQHKNQRGTSFVTHEVNYGALNNTKEANSNLTTILTEHSYCQEKGILVECMATWVAGMLTFCSDLDLALATFLEEKKQLIDTIENSSADIVIISNEVGMGLIGSSKLERVYADELGLLNQSLGIICEQAIQVSAGFPLYLKTKK